MSQPYRGTSATAWTTTHDKLDRPITVTNPDSTEQHLYYLANSVRTTDEAGNEKWFTSNGLGQLTQVQEPNNTFTNYSYYVFGPPHKVTQTGLSPRTFTYDWLSHLLSESHPESGLTEYHPDPDTGLVQYRTDARGEGFKASYTYDAIGRLKTIGTRSPRNNEVKCSSGLYSDQFSPTSNRALSRANSSV